MSERKGADGNERWFRCAAAARWLPRVLAGCVLAAAMFFSFGRTTGPSLFGRAVVFAAALVALWIIRQGAELRTEVGLVEDAVIFGGGGRGIRLDLEKIDSIGYAPFFSSRARPLPAAVLIDRRGRSFRLPALLAHGDRLVELLVSRAGRDDLSAWVEARGVALRMGRATLLVTAGYVLSAATLIAGVVSYLR